MNTFEIIFTAVNACFTCISVYCAIRSAKETEKQTRLMEKQVTAAFKQVEETSKQTEIAQKQLEESHKPDYPSVARLEQIANAIARLNGTFKDFVNGK